MRKVPPNTSSMVHEAYLAVPPVKLSCRRTRFLLLSKDWFWIQRFGDRCDLQVSVASCRIAVARAPYARYLVYRVRHDSCRQKSAYSKGSASAETMMCAMQVAVRPASVIA